MAKYNQSEIEYFFESLLELAFEGVNFSKSCKRLNIDPLIIFYLSNDQKLELKEARKSSKEHYTEIEYLEGFNYLNDNF